jgi:hypothetical protein
MLEQSQRTTTGELGLEISLIVVVFGFVVAVFVAC